MGVALGCMGLSYDDFCKFTPEEFTHVYKAHSEQRDALYKTSWEQTRLLAAICIQPHVRKTIDPKKLLPFSWDRTQRAEEAPKLTKEELNAEYEALVAKLGATI